MKMGVHTKLLEQTSSEQINEYKGSKSLKAFELDKRKINQTNYVLFICTPTWIWTSNHLPFAIYVVIRGPPAQPIKLQPILIIIKVNRIIIIIILYKKLLFIYFIYLNARTRSQESRQQSLCQFIYLLHSLGCLKFLVTFPAKLTQLNGLVFYSQSHQGTINTRVNNFKLTCWVSYWLLVYYISLLFAINSYSFNPMLLVSYLDK